MNGVRRRVTEEQLEILLEAMENDKSFLRQTAKARSFEKTSLFKKWKALSIKLNSVENGAIKSVPKWQQAWRDWKSNIKRKVQAQGHDNLTKQEAAVLKFIDYEHDIDLNVERITEYWFNTCRRRVRGDRRAKIQIAEYILDENIHETEEQMKRRAMEVDVGKTIEEIVFRQNMENSLCERGRREGTQILRFIYIAEAS